MSFCLTSVSDGRDFTSRGGRNQFCGAKLQIIFDICKKKEKFFRLEFNV